MAMRTMGMQFTDLQYDWLRREAERQDRTIPWMVRHLVDLAIAKSETERPERPVIQRRPAA
jgi:hypothetical protein